MGTPSTTSLSTTTTTSLSHTCHRVTNGLFVNAVQLRSHSPYRLVNGDAVSFGPPNQSQFCYQFVEDYSAGSLTPSGGGVGVGTTTTNNNTTAPVGGGGAGSCVSYELSAIGLTTIPATVIPIVTRIQTTTTASGGSAAAPGGHQQVSTNTLRFNIDANQSRTISLRANMPTTRSGVNYSIRSPRVSVSTSVTAPTGGGHHHHRTGLLTMSTSGRTSLHNRHPFRSSRAPVARETAAPVDDEASDNDNGDGRAFVEHDYSTRSSHTGAGHRMRLQLRPTPVSTGSPVPHVSQSERKRFDKEVQRLERTKRETRHREEELRRKQRELDRKEREVAKRDQELEKRANELEKQKRRLADKQRRQQLSAAVSAREGREADSRCDSTSEVSVSAGKRKLRSGAATKETTKRQCNETKGVTTGAAADDDVDCGEHREVPSGDSKSVEEIFESEMTCSVCHEYFIHAVNLNCSHTFCYACIEEWKHSRAGAHVCPICRKKIENQNRELVLDNLIDRFVAKMKPELRQHRIALIAERKERLEKKAAEASQAASRANAAAHRGIAQRFITVMTAGGGGGAIRVAVEVGRQPPPLRRFAGIIPSLHFFLRHTTGGGAANDNTDSGSDSDAVNVIGLDFLGDNSSGSSMSSSSDSSDSSDDDSAADSDDNNDHSNRSTQDMDEGNDDIVVDSDSDPYSSDSDDDDGADDSQPVIGGRLRLIQSDDSDSDSDVSSASSVSSIVSLHTGAGGNRLSPIEISSGTDGSDDDSDSSTGAVDSDFSDD
ncbi:unnamed protein product [Oppiella nova]|uniref:RING-type domain-containing protein n=1 Tax=Oppiella nova TaxID=334625 RepID=A0A7R9QFE7_9ACAR|nr:unnamed protein product [Oppiella nova]CAG2164751.1 unnamed protein product [Oppiella nova]